MWVILNHISMPFALNQKHVLLTYPQCNIAKEDLLHFLRRLFAEASICVGHELHQDGGDHLHAFLKFPEPFRTKNQNVFDYMGHHPNIKGCRHPAAAYEYTKKEGDFCETGEFSFEKKRKWADIFECTNKEEAHGLIKEIAPRDYVLQNERIHGFINKQFETLKTEYIPEYDMTTYTITPTMSDFIEQMNEVTTRGGPRPLPSNTGGPLPLPAQSSQTY